MTSDISTVCPSCGQQRKVPNEYIGRQVKCACGQIFTVTATKPAGMPLESEIRRDFGTRPAHQLHRSKKRTFLTGLSGKDLYGRTPVSDDLHAPQYLGIYFISSVLKIVGVIIVAIGVLMLVSSIFLGARTADIGDFAAGWLMALLLVFWGIMVIGIGQLYAAFRDMAINSYLGVGK